MKTLKKILCATFCTIAFQATIVNAQDADRLQPEYYNNAVGLRLGETSGLTYKHIFKNSNAFEGIVSALPYAFSVTGLYEKYASTGLRGLRWYYGGGGHVSVGLERGMYYTYYRDTRYYYYRYNYPGVGVGADGIIGLEYKIPRIPVAVSTDLKPFVEISNAPNIFFALDPGIGVKFAF